MSATMSGFIGKIRAIRRCIFTKMAMLQCGSYGKGLIVNGKSKLTKSTFLGECVNFNGIVIGGQGQVEIGSYFHSGKECLFITDIHNYNSGEAIPYDNTYVVKNIKIEDFVWLGSRVIVLGGVTIGEGAIIQAGSCVVGDIPPLAVAGGHPAKVFSYRDKEHFYRLKKEGRFN